jgi:hypothetical protein
MTLAAGTRLGAYEIVALAGSGTVYSRKVNASWRGGEILYPQSNILVIGE